MQLHYEEYPKDIEIIQKIKTHHIQDDFFIKRHSLF